ncbi:MAG: type I 3-dehydroquinate dehydratase [Methanomicrobiales archaeon]|nr:type I 3-dehydroquinate dehydratase [Methanomicrobiales archaeon]
MRIVATVVNAREAALAADLCPDLIEARIDLMAGDPGKELRSIRSAFQGPVILTLRSTAEGGRFGGGTEAWWECLRPLLPFGDLVDIERPYSAHADRIRGEGKGIIASCHVEGMPSPEELPRLERELRAYGDIPKIVVRPASERDLLDLLGFTLGAGRPICTGVLGEAFRFARAILPFFGSELAYTHAGTPGAAGQFSLGDFRRIQALLGT